MTEPRHVQVHGVEEGIASVETQDGRLFELPSWLLPADARAGDRLRIRVEGGAPGEVRICVERDALATESARAEAAARLRRLTRADEGGDLDL